SRLSVRFVSLRATPSRILGVLLLDPRSSGTSVFLGEPLRKNHGRRRNPGTVRARQISRSPPEMFFVSVLEITTLANGILLGRHEIREATPKLIGSILRMKLGLWTNEAEPATS
ncbi:MAG: hypothetical protein WA847_10965, partial [Terriglobales bacterium]